MEISHWHDRSRYSWVARKAALASRGEVDGDRVQQCKDAVMRWKLFLLLVKEWGMPEDQARAAVAAVDDVMAAI